MAKRLAARRAWLAVFLAAPLLWMGCSSTSGENGGGNASLTSVSFSAGALRPATFAPETLSYYLDLPYGTTTFTLVPTAADPSATITVVQDGGAPVTVVSGAATPDLTVPAVGGYSIVSIAVKAGGATQSYGFLLTQLVGHDATLSGLAVSLGDLNPAFSTAKTSYALSLPAGTASITVTPTANDPTATLTLAQDAGSPVAIASGATSDPLPVPPSGTVSSVKVKVTAQDGTTIKTYSIAVSQLSSSDATLSVLGETSGGLSFSPATTTYSYNVPFQTAYTVTPTPTSPRASVKVNGVAVANGTASQPISLTPGVPVPIAIEVTAQDGTTKQTYTLAVTEGPQAGLVTPRTVPTDASVPLAVAANATLPANNAAEVPADTLLRIGFDGAPTLGTTGTIVIHRTSDGAAVDTINLADPYLLYDGTAKTVTNVGSTKANVIGGNADQVRIVNYVPVMVSGNTATIYPHNYKLAYNTSYYVTIDAGVLTGTRGGSAFTGISSATAWTFTTKASAPTTRNVAADGSADFATVQGAIDAIAAGSSAAVTITIAPGVYQEMLFIRNKKNITFQGSGAGVDTVVQYDNFDGFNPATGANFAPATAGGAPGTPPTITATSVAGGGRPLLLLSSTTGIVFDGITLKNTHAHGSPIAPTIPSGAVTYTNYTAAAQAETMYFNSQSGTLVAKRSNFVSYQDTIQVKGWSWFYDCLLTGDTDFIWGAANTAVFERSELRSRFNANGEGYVVNARNYAPDTGASTTAPTTLTRSYAGFVFLNSAFTREDATVTAFLARSQGPLSTSGSGTVTYYGYDDVALINCSMDAHIQPIGWSMATQKSPTTGPNVAPSAVVGWREYRSFTPGGQWVDVSQRMPNPSTSTTTGFGSIQLTDANVATFFPDRATILGGVADTGSTGTGLTTVGVAGGWNPQP